MMIRDRRRLIVVVTVVAYLCTTLFPFDWEWPIVENHARWRGEALSFPSSGIARTTQPLAWLADALAFHELRISLRALPYRAAQAGPARIFTVSLDPYRRNLTIAQDGDDLVLRVRADSGDDNGLPERRFVGVLGARRWHDIDLALAPGRMTVSVDGRCLLDEPLSRTPLARFHPLYPLALGNELSANRAWLGEIARATVVTRNWSVEYVEPRRIELPRFARLFHNEPTPYPFSLWDPQDWLVNFFGFVPFGIVVGLATRARGSRRILCALVPGFLLSLIIEVCQWGLPRRFSSIDDLILNTLGGVLGFAAVVALKHWATAGADQMSSSRGAG